MQTVQMFHWSMRLTNADVAMAFVQSQPDEQAATLWALATHSEAHGWEDRVDSIAAQYTLDELECVHTWLRRLDQSVTTQLWNLDQEACRADGQARVIEHWKRRRGER